MTDTQTVGLALVCFGVGWMLSAWVQYRRLEKQMWEDFRQTFTWTDGDDVEVRIYRDVYDWEKDDGW
jgi:hypothetical protein